MKKSILLSKLDRLVLFVVGLLLVARSVASGQLGALADWNSPAIAGRNTWTLVAILGGLYLIRLSFKKITKVHEAGSVQIEDSEHVEAEVKNRLYSVYGPYFKSLLQISDQEAQQQFDEVFQKISKEAHAAGTTALPLNHGDSLLSKEETDEKIKDMLKKKRKEGVTDEDIRWWWNMHDIERRLMLHIDEISRLQAFTEEIQNSEAEDPAKEAARRVSQFHPIFGDTVDAKEVRKPDSPLPHELKNRINIYIEERALKDAALFKRDMESASSFNALIRSEIKAGKI